ncbi:hypothetical protein J807_0774 [Acinetobacter sp. 25977_4]|uniref:hypothetical protein n=1 Tax=Acinetobacter sp. 25977_4 TaxID=1310908 RepID=UPI0004498055|nr:hypothetical protein [Acinetobacter sp. 25977_4]EXT52307.1 hypothetical protein J807_0774 [Acinetobacter sp. 25977_4]
MFGMLESLTKAAVSVAVAPVTAVVDAVMIPLMQVKMVKFFKELNQPLTMQQKTLAML